MKQSAKHPKVIWFVHHHIGAPSLGMSYRGYYLAREWQKQGHTVCLIGASYHHLINKQTIQTERFQLEKNDGVQYLWIKTPKYKTNSIIKRLWNAFCFSYQLWANHKEIIMLAKQPDVIISSSPHPMAYLATRKIAAMYKAKHIFDVQDLWPASIIELLNISKINPVVLFFAWIEKLAYREADHVVAVMPNALEYMLSRGLNKERFTCIPNGTDTTVAKNLISLPRNLDIKIKSLQQQNKFVIAYVGAHGTPNALEQWIDALQILQNNGDTKIHALFVGQGAMKEALIKRAALLTNISFFDPIPKAAVPTLLEQVDSCFIGWQNKNLYRYGVSANKIFDYMLAGKPIIHATNAFLDPVQSANCGVIIPPENPVKLAESVQQLAAMDFVTLEAMGKRGIAYVEANHDYTFLAKKYSELMT